MTFQEGKNEMRSVRVWLRAMAILGILTTSFVAIELSTGFHRIQEIDKLSEAEDNGYIYISVQHESNPICLENEEKTIDSFKQINSELSTCGIDYYEVYRQPLDCSESSHVTYDAVSGELRAYCKEAQCIQISENVQEAFELSVDVGRNFCRDDYLHERNEAIPVIMGNHYSDSYFVGDIFSGQYLFEDFDFIVIGFLKEGCKMKFSFGCTNLDEYILMPSFIFANNPQNENEYVTQKIHYANKASGVIKTNEYNFSGDNERIKIILDASQVGSFSVSSSSMVKSYLMNGVNLRLINIFLWVICLGMFFLALWECRKIIAMTEKIQRKQRIMFCFGILGALGISEIISFALLYLVGMCFFSIKWVGIEAILFLLALFAVTNKKTSAKC